MTTQEFSLEFDILYNNTMSNQAPSLSAYEKSVFLTQAQEQLVYLLYEGSTSASVGFETSEKLTESLKELVKEVTLPINNLSVEIPKDLLFIVREYVNLKKGSITCDSITTREVVPSTHDTINRMLKNPFTGPLADRVLRLTQGNTLKLFSKDNSLSTYSLTYLRKPLPIIIEDLPEDYIDTDMLTQEEVQLTLDGRTKRTECELNPILHRQILQTAVQLAKVSWKL